MKTNADTPQTLQMLCRQAGEQAAGWHSGRTAPPRRRPLLKFALAAGLGLLTLLVLAAQFGTAPTTSSAPAPAHSTAPPPTAVEAVQWQRHELVVDIEQVPRQQADAPGTAATPRAPLDAVPGEIESQPDGSC